MKLEVILHVRLWIWIYTHSKSSKFAIVWTWLEILSIEYQYFDSQDWQDYCKKNWRLKHSMYTVVNKVIYIWCKKV